MYFLSFLFFLLEELEGFSVLIRLIILAGIQYSGRKVLRELEHSIEKLSGNKLFNWLDGANRLFAQ